MPSALKILVVSAPAWLGLWSMHAGTRPPAAPKPPASVSVAVSRQLYLMGTRCTLTTYAPSRQVGLKRLESYLKILERVEQQLSTWREKSPLSRINAAPVGQPIPIGPELCRLFGELFDWHRATEKAFDPAIGSLVEAWNRAESGMGPAPDILRAAAMNAGMEHLKFGATRCQLLKQRSIRLDSGAFGKGEALDQVFKASSNQESMPWMINLGGQIMVFGHPPGHTFWRVALAHPQMRAQTVLELKLTRGSLSTSSGSERDRFVDGVRIGHILDPRGGRPVRFDGSVTVWHERGLVADILSTALYVMGPEKGLPWAEERGIAACFLLLPTHAVSEGQPVQVRASKAFSRRFL